jgi:hypothetical protein
VDAAEIMPLKLNKPAAYIKAKRCGRLFILLMVSILLSAPGFGAIKRYVPPTVEQIETELLEMINRDRELSGRKPLLHHPFLQEIARSHSGKMAEEDKLSHFFPGWPAPEQKLRLGNFCFLVNAENIVCSLTPFSKFIHEALMASIMHKINILDERMLQAGIGVCKTGNKYYISEEFAAIFDCPVAETVMVLLENDLCQWYKKKFNMIPVILSEARLSAKVCAQQYLINNPISLEAINENKMRVINISYNDIKTILIELKKEIKGNSVKSLAVGVAWGHTASFPGGTYSVSLLLFE